VANNQEKNVKDKINKHKPYSICEKRNKNNRFHPEAQCWYKDKDNEKKRMNKLSM